MSTFTTKSSGKSATEQKDYKNYDEARSIFKSAIEACMAGDVKKFVEIVDSFILLNPGVTAQDFFMEFKSEGKTLMHLAASSGHKLVVDAIIGKSVDPSVYMSVKDNSGFTPFINACIGESIDIMKQFLSLGSDVNDSNKDGAAAIHFAAGDGSIERLSFLLDNGANINIPSQGGTPLHWAAHNGNAKVVTFLSKKGCDLEITNKEGATAIMAAAAGGHDLAVTALVAAGANVGSVFVGNLTLLHICAENGLHQAVRAILKTDTGKKCVSLATVDGNLPLHLAAMTPHLEIIDDLLPLSKDLPGVAGMDTVSEIIADGARRLEQWNVKYSSSSSSSSSSDSVLPKEAIEPAKDEEAIAQAEEFKVKGNELFKAKDFNAAIKAYSAGLEKQGDNKFLWSNRSACYLAMGEKEKALKDAEICRRVDPLWTKACYRLGAARLALGMYEDAALAAFEGCKIDESNDELKVLMQKAVKMGQQEHRQKNEGGGK